MVAPNALRPFIFFAYQRTMVIQRQQISMVYQGRTYEGAWYVEHDQVHVESVYGCRSADLCGLGDRAQGLAELLFRSLVRGWLPNER